MSSTDFDLIGHATRYTVGYTGQARSLAERELERGGGTKWVTALRMLTMQSTIVAVGAVSVFESLLQQHYGWGRHAFSELDRHLRDSDFGDLASRFRDVRDAINVLKHGRGDKHVHGLGLRTSAAC